jgi:WD40 repeat protein
MEIAAVVAVLALAVAGLPDIMLALAGLSADEPVDQSDRGGISEVTPCGPDGKVHFRLINGALWWLDLTSGIHEQIALPAGAHVLAVCRSDDGRWLATGFVDGRVVLEHLSSGEVFDVPQSESAGVRDTVTTLQFSRDSRRLAVGRDRGHIDVWNLTAEGVDESSDPARLAAHADSVVCLRWLADGRLISTGRDSACRLWDVDGGRLVREFASEATMVFCADVSANGRLLVTAGNAFTVHGWETDTGRLLWTTRLDTPWVTEVVLHPTGPVACGTPRGGPVLLLDRQTGNILRQLPGHDNGIASIQLDTDGARMVTAGYDGTIRLWHAGPNAADWHLLRIYDCGRL